MSDLIACWSEGSVLGLVASVDMAGPACDSLYDSAVVPWLMSLEVCDVDSSSYATDVYDLYCDEWTV